ncbi:hypothetical protein HPB51_009674 [Rhipicephalus microplus]|uniref:Uncharacterized protein n=1 Tax=Rhipicephalus microplus TaxID=6941 RepID=A0A9J6ESM9_RHIMP|nr:hypothetical protein HPB51_009674 [Rhipicephalus microplus]
MATRKGLTTCVRSSTESYVSYIQGMLTLCRRVDEQMTESDNEQIEEFQTKHKVKIEGEGVSKPILKLEEAGLPEEFVSKIKDVLGSSLPALASYGLPALLSNRDFIGLGDSSMSEKVISFLPSVVMHCQRNIKSDAKGPVALLLASSCRQVRDIYKYFRDTGRSLDLECLEISEETSNDREDFQSGKRCLYSMR